jgi:hypothetical protein
VIKQAIFRPALFMQIPELLLFKGIEEQMEQGWYLDFK